MQFQTMRSVAGVLLAILIVGCSHPPKLSEALVGYWTSDKEQGFLEFGPAGLYAREVEGSPMEVGSWSVQGHTLKMVSKAGENAGQNVEWKIKMTGPLSFEQPLNQARFRRYHKSPHKSVAFEPRLVGLWKQTSTKNSDLVEFTPRGTQIGLIWKTDSTGQKVLQGSWGRVTRLTQSQFGLTGLVGVETYSPEQPNEFQFEGERLSWTVGRQKRLMHKTAGVD